MTSKRILIVEDAMDIGRMLQAAIATLGAEYTVTLMRSAEEAILETSRHKLDLVVTDIRLPGIDGFELVRRVKRRLPDVRVIIITGLSERDYQKQIREVKPDAVLEKPIEISRFLEKVNQILEAAEPQPQVVEKIAPVQSSSNPERVLSSKLTDILNRLHTAAGAQMVLLLDAEGVVAAEVASLQSGLSVDGKSIRDILTSAGGLTLAGRKAQVIVRGTQLDWVLQPLGSDFTLALILPSGSSILRLGLALEEIQRVQNDLLVIFGQAPNPPQDQAQKGKTGPLISREPAQVKETPPELPAVPVPLLDVEKDLLAELQAASLPKKVEEKPEPIPEDPAALEAFAALFSTPEEKTAAVQDLDSFWEAAAEKKRTFTGIPDAITFEEAQQLGLAPAEDDEK